MAIHYVLKQGKLINQGESQARKAFWRALFCIGLAVCFGCGYFMAFQTHSIPKDSIVISKKVYEHLLHAEDTLAHVSSKMDQPDYVLTIPQLKKVFSFTFPEVKLSDELLEKYLTSVMKWSAEYSIPPLLVLSVIWRESFFDASIISSANARGPMQVIYKYHKEKLDRLQKDEQDLHNIDVGIHVGVEILREYFDRYDRDLFRAMTAYVGGTHRTYAQDIITRYFNARMYVEEQL